MKYIRYQKDDKIHIGVINPGNTTITPLEYDTIFDAIENESDVKAKIESLHDYDIVKLSDVKILPVCTPSKVVCVGLNYTDHAEELNMNLPDEPLLFIKPSTAVIGDHDTIIYPDSSKQLDYEGELGVVILDKTKDTDDATSHIAGYTVVNDVTARDLQQKDGQWTRAKSFDTFAPIGPVISTDIDPMTLNITTSVNGEIKQASNTSNMIFSPRKLVEYVSKIMTLNPGDIIATGTPPGVGQLHVGDKVSVTIEDIGTLENTVKKIIKS
ncbi:fumarylacetoacetate hydrolase family protein [Methanosphaera cuniculi]|uniref:Ureidoglycolate lyase n=2 Tax=Methanosphaera cuniculi TaxID=1077256 RepID=A0A2A2HD87_9EURY|nr:fumarylacetoacetate hydrolase family protein [Methanosphaera cuniculi]PAV07298.1 hypothetical protein ASJ82_00165 [Methanosphaera cuniculi]PWL08990.1 ureidoglycolate lyase [Methanosphaera cuniculi]